MNNQSRQCWWLVPSDKKEKKLDEQEDEDYCFVKEWLLADNQDCENDDKKCCPLWWHWNNCPLSQAQAGGDFVQKIVQTNPLPATLCLDVWTFHVKNSKTGDVTDDICDDENDKDYI